MIKTLFWKTLNRLTPEEVEKAKGILINRAEDEKSMPQVDASKVDTTEKNEQNDKKKETDDEKNNQQGDIIMADVENVKKDEAPAGQPAVTPAPAPQPVPQPQGEVQGTPTPTHEGISVNDLMTKSMFDDFKVAMSSKLDAILKENTDLKTALDAEKAKTAHFENKYENKDFGNTPQRGGMGIASGLGAQQGTANRPVNDSFNTYMDDMGIK